MAKNFIVLRPSNANDEAFVDGLLFTTMHEYVEATWPGDPAAQQRYYRINRFDPLITKIIQIGNKDIGRLSTTIRADCIFINELHILPEYQRRGIGAQLIGKVFKEAHENSLDVKLTVLTVNPAQHLYIRMGFRVVEEKDGRLYMQCKLPDAIAR